MSDYGDEKVRQFINKYLAGPTPEETAKVGVYRPVPATEFHPDPGVRQSARDRQVGGDHYKRHAVQPWDIIDHYGMGFYDGNALKYLLRYRNKGGVEDLRKARHYIDKMIENEEGPE